MLREVDDLHAAAGARILPIGAARAEDEWQRLIDEDHGAVFVAEPAGADGAIAVLVARVYDTPDNPAMVPRRRAARRDAGASSRKHRRRGSAARLMDEARRGGASHGAVEWC